MKAESALSLLTELLTDLRQVQLQVVKWLPGLAGKVHHPGLRHLIGKHVAESTVHLERLERFFALHDLRPVEGVSKAIKLMIAEPEETVPAAVDPDRTDLVLMIQMLRVEQFEITSYEIVARVAEQLGFAEDTEMLLEFLAERDAAASILRELQAEMIRNAFPTEVRPEPLFVE